MRALYEVRRREFGSREGIELVMDDGPSVLLWNGTDWIVRINAGRWPELPTRAWPPQAWEFVQGEVPATREPTRSFPLICGSTRTETEWGSSRDSVRPGW